MGFPNPSVSALVLDENGAILSIETHKECGKPHAEVLALQKAYVLLSGDKAILNLEDSALIHAFLLENAKNIFKDCTIYVSLEPCSSKKQGKTPSCAMLLKNLGLKRVIIGAQDKSKGASGGADELELSNVEVVKAWEVASLREINAKFNALLIPFYCMQNKGQFVLFKYASRLDGSIDKGQISSRFAQSHMHNFRVKADFLLISGKSVCLDNPRLDTRFATLKQKNPNIAILTRKKNFPKTAPLFSIPNRKVEILHCLDSVQSLKGFVLCEGGAELFSAMCESMDMLLVILNPSFNADAMVKMQLFYKFDLLYSFQIGEDLLLWLTLKQNV